MEEKWKLKRREEISKGNLTAIQVFKNAFFILQTPKTALPSQKNKEISLRCHVSKVTPNAGHYTLGATTRRCSRSSWRSMQILLGKIITRSSLSYWRSAQVKWFLVWSISGGWRSMQISLCLASLNLGPIFLSDSMVPNSSNMARSM